MASNNIARLGVVLGLDSAQFQADIDKAVAATRNLKNQIKRETNAAAAEIINLTNATQDYGKTLTKVEQIQREVSSGRYMMAEQKFKNELLARAAAYDRVVEAKQREAKQQAVSDQATAEIASLTRATEDYGKTLTRVELMQREISGGKYQLATEEQKQQLLAAAAAFDRVTLASKASAKGLSEHQKITITYQMTDLVTQLASGQNAMIAIIQQGGQLKDQLGGIGPMFRALGSFITPVSVGLAALGSTVGVLGFAFYKGAQESAKFSDDMILTGNYANLLGKDITQITSKIASDFGVSIGTARESLMELSATGKYTETSLYAVNEAVLRFAKISGVDARDAAKELAQYFDGTASAAKRMNDKFHVLTLEQYKQIEAMERSAKTQQAMKVAADAFNSGMEERVRNLGFLERAWKGIKDSISEAWDALKGFGREDLGQKRADLERNIASSKEKIAESPPDSKLAQTETLRLRRMEAQLEVINKQIGDAEERAKKAADEANAIDVYNRTGALTGYLQRAEQLYKQQYGNRLQMAMAYQDDEYKAEQQALHDLAVARKAVELKNIEEGGLLRKENAKQLAEVELGIMIKLNQDVTKIRKDQLQERMMAEYDALEEQKEIARAFRREQAFAKSNKMKELDDEQESMRFAHMRLELSREQSSMTNKDYRIAEERLALEERLANLMRDKSYSDQDKVFLAQQMKKNSAMKESFIAIEDSIQRMGDKWDSVFNNMSNAIETFVRTGKFSFNDLARSIIQDLIMVELKAQGQVIFGFLKKMVLQAMNAPTDTSLGELGINTDLPGKASGGTVSSMTPYMVGERGPELFVPSQSGTIIPNNNLASVGGTTNVTNYNISAIDVKSFEDRILGSAKAVWAANAYANKGLAVSQGRA